MSENPKDTYTINLHQLQWLKTLRKQLADCPRHNVGPLPVGYCQPGVEAVGVIEIENGVVATIVEGLDFSQNDQEF